MRARELQTRGAEVKTDVELGCAPALERRGVRWRRVLGRVGEEPCGWGPQVSETRNGAPPSWLGCTLVQSVEQQA